MALWCSQYLLFMGSVNGYYRIYVDLLAATLRRRKFYHVSTFRYFFYIYARKLKILPKSSERILHTVLLTLMLKHKPILTS